jgi:hypothetical protein
MAGVTIGTASFPTLTAQPFGYDETDTSKGFTARRWAVQGLLKPSEWLALTGAYDTWRNTRINDEDTLVSGVVGTTINFSGKGAGGVTWTNVPCWFTEAPSAEQSGAYLQVSVSLVDAAQALQVLQEEQERSQEDDDRPNLGTLTIGTTTLTLLKPADTYASGPQAELTATGVHYITGALVPVKIRDVEGTTNLTGWNALRSWYETEVSSVPATNDWFPITPPVATAENVIVSGVKSVQYTVTLQLAQII